MQSDGPVTGKWRHSGVGGCAVSIQRVFQNCSEAVKETICAAGMRWLLVSPAEDVMAADIGAMLHCAEEADRRHMRAFKVLYHEFVTDPTEPADNGAVTAGTIFTAPDGFHTNVWGHPMAGPYDSWQAAAAYARLILDSEDEQ